MARSLISPHSPEGLSYQRDFLSPKEEQDLLGEIANLPLEPFQMRGEVSKRRVAHFGWDYQYDAWKIHPTTPFPGFLSTLRNKAAAAFNQDSNLFEAALINGYPPGAGIGWHRDAPMFGEPILGISLGCDCVMSFRKRVEDGYHVYKQPLEARSIYALSGPSRKEWQHTIPAVAEQRYSITFRKIARRPVSF